MTQETICAIATAPGGAIGIIRVSGPEAIALTARIFSPLQGASLTDRKPYTLTFGTIAGADGQVLDEVLVSLFRAPHSYTGEDSTEIMCHGSAYILQQVLQRLISVGCRMAHPGEYTQRAYLNGKMDLSQAEAVADLIAASSAATHRMAMNQMRGGFSRELSQLRDKLLHLTSLMELELDFSDHEELEFADRTELIALIQDIQRVIRRLADSFKVGNALRTGIPTVIVGRTNAGKSTLLNALLHEEKAIVSNIHGTTRDTIEDTFVLGGVTFRFIDTAGIRHTEDQIEHIGIQRAYDKMDKAEIILWVVDGSEDDSLQADSSLAAQKEEILSHCQGKHLIVLFNKCDRLTPGQRAALEDSFADVPGPHLFISAATGEHLPELETLLLQETHLSEVNTDEVIVSNARHYEALCHALQCAERVEENLRLGVSNDLTSEDLRECIYSLGEIVSDGVISPEETLNNIFKNFCIGK
jgi:tRNA modification GTPase